LIYVDDALGGAYTVSELAYQEAISSNAEDHWIVTSSERLLTPRRHDRDDEVDDGSADDRRRRVCRRLRRTFGPASILLVTRGFESILISAYSQYVRVGGTLSLESHYGTVARESRFEGLRPEDVGDYDAAIRLYRCTFGDENVLVLPYELLRDDPTRFLGRIEEHLGLEPKLAPPVPRLNPALTPADLYWYPRISRCVERCADPFRSVGRAVFARYVNRIDRGPLRRVVRLLARLTPQRAPYSEQLLPPGLVERFRGRASLLANDPTYQPYSADYLNS
jgi:hypothetical protein